MLKRIGMPTPMCPKFCSCAPKIFYNRVVQQVQIPSSRQQYWVPMKPVFHETGFYIFLTATYGIRKILKPYLEQTFNEYLVLVELPRRLNEETYLNFLPNDLPILFDRQIQTQFIVTQIPEFQCRGIIFLGSSLKSLECMTTGLKTLINMFSYFFIYV